MVTFMRGCFRRTLRKLNEVLASVFTPRPIIDVMVYLMQPRPGDVLQDPAAGTGGFLVAAQQHVRAKHPDQVDSPPLVLSGMENVTGYVPVCDRRKPLICMA